EANDRLGIGYQPQYNPNTPTESDPNNLFINNVTPDAGFSAPFNTWTTLFGQFFDHGLDLVTKGGSGTVFIPLQEDDPLYVPGGHTNFMVLTRATNAADGGHEGTNTITPFVDQSQTYSSHPSHQVFLREYAVGVDGHLHSTGNLLSHTNLDGSKGMATWADLKANALKLGILLTDADVNDVPLLATDAFGNFIAGVHGFAQIVKRGAGTDGILGNSDDTSVMVEGTVTGVDTTNAFRTGHAFINDKAHTADPFDSQTGALLRADTDTTAGNQPTRGFYDNELLDAHYVAGDGRINENIGLTAVHEIFHSEHNRLVEQTKDFVRAELANGDSAFASDWVLPGTNLANGIQDNEWNGERLFQAAKFGTEVQYQHLVFEEFARKIAPSIHLFGNNNIHLDPAITAEFAHAVYRFGHSMLDETLNRLDANGNVVGDGNPATVDHQMSLIEAFTNPLAYLQQGDQAAAQLVRGATSQVGNEIDEFVTGALRNNLLGLPLDLAALNIARGRETGVAPINLVRNQIFDATHDATLKPYESWDDFGQYLKHPASLINFV
ncbi:MAG TPA: peroxidase family protein, partial [Albitalea sp.]|nr:peroxidase family protein [Albitalea sp.]